MTTDALGYYKILRCSTEADEHELKISYRDNAKLWHPDHNKAPNALEQFQKISLAYNILSNPKNRLVYDLLCLVYSADDFPDMKALKIYKSADGEETPFLRVFKLNKVLKGIKNTKTEEQNLIGTFKDAEKFIKSITKHNWLYGWWNTHGIKRTINALKNNYRQINKNNPDNFKMLVHNAAAFYAENKDDKAVLSLIQSLEYADSKQTYIEKLITPASTTNIPHWDYEHLKKIQLFIPKTMAIIALALILISIMPFLTSLNSSDKNKSISYYQEVHFNNGNETVDDVVVSKILNIPVDITDEKMLYHTTEQTKAMYGPSDKFDVLAKVRFRQTVRVTGYTTDKEWYRVMLDNGEMGFIKQNYLKSGIGRKIPQDSKIFYNPALQ